MLTKLNLDKIKSHLETKFLAHKIIILESVDSTQNYAERYLDDLTHGTLIVAEYQTQGKGRLGRIWHSTYGKGICMSLILKNSFQVETLPHITVLASLSLAKFLESSYHYGFKIRWPNDVILEKEKIAGTLAEIKRDSFIIGIGLNVNQNFQELPEVATSIFLHTGREEDRNVIIAHYLNQFEEDFYLLIEKGFGFLREFWLNYTSLRGKEVITKTNSRELVGVVEDLSCDCGLVLRGDMGYQFKVNFNQLEQIRVR